VLYIRIIWKFVLAAWVIDKRGTQLCTVWGYVVVACLAIYAFYIYVDENKEEEEEEEGM
jgi:hypothetical protein